MDKQQIIKKLIAFLETEKFSSPAWERRGLNPSSQEMSEELERLFNNCTNELIAYVDSGNYNGLKYVLKTNLKKFNSGDYDTEEREFICDCFFELSAIVEIDFKDNLDRWLYGSSMNIMLKVIKLLKKDPKSVDTLCQDCTKCGAKLQTFIVKRQEGIPDSSWFIIQCNNCKEYNLLSKGPNIKELRFGNYNLTEQLNKSEYDESEAIIRLKQIRYFRK